jgi:nitrogen fixation/metabolism regulation signal transduction histidine kinase
MVFKRFGLLIILRVVILFLTIALEIYIILNTQLYATIFILSIIIFLQIYFLIKFVSRTNKEIVRFLDSIKYSDFSQNFNLKLKGSSFEDLSSSFSEVISKFQNTRAEKEEHYRYLQTVIQHIGIGLIAYTSDGEIELINNSAKKMFKLSALKNINELSKFDKDFPAALLKLRSGNKLLQKIVDDNELIQLAISATEFRMRGKEFTLVSLQNIQNELEDIEIEAWQKLIKVLTHEIMNSITPITSLASTADSILKNYESSPSKNEDDLKEHLIDVRGAINTIQKRSNGLLHFVDAYRNLTKVPIPNFGLVNVDNLFKRVNTLLTEEISKRKIQLSCSVKPESFVITADADQVEQVLINLVLNSMYALEETKSPVINLIAFIDRGGHAKIQVIDNGPGIPEDIIEKIFIPFYTTRKGGSGIGLSLSQQIMRAHRGNLRVTSLPGEGTTFTLRF